MTSGSEAGVQATERGVIPRLLLMQIESGLGVSGRLKFNVSAVQALWCVAIPGTDVSEVVKFGDASARRSQPARGNVAVGINSVTIQNVGKDHPGVVISTFENSLSHSAQSHGIVNFVAIHPKNPTVSARKLFDELVGFSWVTNGCRLNFWRFADEFLNDLRSRVGRLMVCDD